MKVISTYELLGLIKQGKQPGKIKYFGNIYKWEEDWYYTEKKNYKVFLGGNVEDGNQLFNAFNENVEITEEDKEIEKINSIKVPTISNSREKNIENIEETLKKYWLVIDKLTEAVNELKKGK